MPVTFQPSGQVRATIPLVFGFAGPAGSGKTYSTLKMASSMVSPEELFVIDTEGGRALAYRDEFQFQYAMLGAPYTVAAYVEAVEAAVAAGAKCVVIDSGSHEHEGEGGMLQQAEEVLDRMAGNDWAKRERCQMVAWAKVKPPRNRFISYLMGLPIVTIICFQARPKTRPGDKKKGEESVVKMGFQPICGAEYTFALTAFAMFDPKNPGVPIFNEDVKPLMHQLRHVFPEGKQIDGETGRLLQEWCKGGKPLSDRQDVPAPKQTITLNLVTGAEEFPNWRVAAENLIAALEGYDSVEMRVALMMDNVEFDERLRKAAEKSDAARVFHERITGLLVKPSNQLIT